MSDIIEQNEGISEENSVKPVEEEQEICSCSVRINGALQKRISASTRKLLLVYLIVGAVFLAGYIVLSVLNGEVLVGKKFTVEEGLLWTLLLCGAVLFALGLVLLIMVRKNIKSAEALNQENSLRFFQSYVIIQTVRANERIGELKYYYADFVKVKEKKEFFFLYPNNVTLFPVPKEQLTEEQIVLLRRVLPLKR